MKILLYRCNSLFTSVYSFRDIYLLSTAADGEKSVINGAINGLQGWIDCFGKAKLTGVLCGVGITNSGEAKQHTALLKDAYVLGNKI